MTVIVAALTTHRVGRKNVEAITIACDSQISDEWLKVYSEYPKIWTKDERKLLLGSSGYVAAAQALKHFCDWPYYPTDQDWEEWLVGSIRPLIIGVLGEAELIERRRGVISMEMSMIIATGTKLAAFDSVGGVVVPVSPRIAIGSGYAEALGFLEGKSGPPWTSDDVIGAALAATKSARGCGPPIFWATTLDFEIKEADLKALGLQDQ